MVKLYEADAHNNWARFFKLAREATYLVCCELQLHFDRVRRKALGTMARTFQGFVPLAALQKTLCFDTLEHTQDFVQHCGYSVVGHSDGLGLSFNKKQVDRDTDNKEEPYPSRKSALVLSKKPATVKEAMTSPGGSVVSSAQAFAMDKAATKAPAVSSLRRSKMAIPTWTTSQTPLAVGSFDRVGEIDDQLSLVEPQRVVATTLAQQQRQVAAVNKEMQQAEKRAKQAALQKLQLAKATRFRKTSTLKRHFSSWLTNVIVNKRKRGHSSSVVAAHRNRVRKQGYFSFWLTKMRLKRQRCQRAFSILKTCNDKINLEYKRKYFISLMEHANQESSNHHKATVFRRFKWLSYWYSHHLARQEYHKWLQQQQQLEAALQSAGFINPEANQKKLEALGIEIRDLSLHHKVHKRKDVCRFMEPCLDLATLLRKAFTSQNLPQHALHTQLGVPSDFNVHLSVAPSLSDTVAAGVANWLQHQLSCSATRSSFSSSTSSSSLSSSSSLTFSVSPATSSSSSQPSTASALSTHFQPSPFSVNVSCQFESALYKRPHSLIFLLSPSLRTPTANGAHSFALNCLQTDLARFKLLVDSVDAQSHLPLLVLYHFSPSNIGDPSSLESIHPTVEHHLAAKFQLRALDPSKFATVRILPLFSDQDSAVCSPSMSTLPRLDVSTLTNGLLWLAERSPPYQPLFPISILAVVSQQVEHCMTFLRSNAELSEGQFWPPIWVSHFNTMVKDVLQCAQDSFQHRSDNPWLPVPRTHPVFWQHNASEVAAFCQEMGALFLPEWTEEVRNAFPQERSAAFDLYSRYLQDSDDLLTQHLDTSHLFSSLDHKQDDDSSSWSEFSNLDWCRVFEHNVYQRLEALRQQLAPKFHHFLSDIHQTSFSHNISKAHVHHSIQPLTKSKKRPSESPNVVAFKASKVARHHKEITSKLLSEKQESTAFASRLDKLNEQLSKMPKTQHYEDRSPSASAQSDFSLQQPLGSFETHEFAFSTTDSEQKHASSSCSRDSLQAEGGGAVGESRSLLSTLVAAEIEAGRKITERLVQLQKMPFKRKGKRRRAKR